MKKSFTYKKLNVLLLALAICIFWGVYAYSVSPLIENREKANALYEQLSTLKNASTNISNLKEQLQVANNRLGDYNENQLTFQQRLLEIVSKQCLKLNLTLHDFKEPVIEEKDGFFIETSHFVVKGSYQNLLKLIYIFEQEERVGKLANVKFEKRKNTITKEIYLVAEIYIQNIRKDE